MSKSYDNARDLEYIDFIPANNSLNFNATVISGGAPIVDATAGVYANGAYLQANAAYNAANSVNVYGANTSVTSYFAVPIGNTAQKPASSPLGALRYNTSNNALESYVSTGWLSVVSDTPSIQSVSPTSFTGNVGTTFTITGTNFKPDATVSFVTGNGSFVIAASVVYVGQTELRATTIRDFTVAEEPLGVRVSQSNGAGVATLVGVIDCGSIPTWNSSAGSLGTYYDASRTNLSIQLGGYDGEDANANLIFSISTGGLPSGLALNANGAITGTPSAVVANTTNNFSVIITDSAGNQSAERSFSFTILAPITFATYTYTGSDQSLTLPAGISSFKAHIWGGGGGCFYYDFDIRGGGGGYTTGAITGPAGNTYTVVVGNAGDSRGGGAGVSSKRYGGGGQATSGGWGGQGGGLSGIFIGTGTVFSGATLQAGAQARAILIAGGGGGSGDSGWGGSGGGTSGRNVYGTSGGSVGSYGAGLQTDSNNGYDGAPQKGGALVGGDGNGGDQGGGGGGGAGYFGGGGGSGQNGPPNSGGGGSGFVGGAPGVTVSNATTEQGTDKTPGGTTQTYYNSSYAFGAQGTTYATAGRIVITI